MTRNMAVAFFYVLVVLHGLHLIGGLIVWSRAFARLLGSAPPEKLLLTVDLCARYWHFLLVVWLAMFGRSEEHTSELQSLMRISYAVFCLTKKNKKNKNK